MSHRFLQIAFWSLLWLCSSKASLEASERKPGHYDLTGARFEKDLFFSDSWFFAGSEFVDPRTIFDRIATDKPELAKPGQSFAQLMPKAILPEQGYASYWIFLDNIPSDQSLAMVPPEAFTAYDIYWIPAHDRTQVHLLYRAGKIGTSAESSYPGSPTTKPVRFPDGQRAGVLLMHLSNFHHSWGGIWHPPGLGRADLVFARAESQLQSNFLMIGVLLFIAFYDFSLFFRRREDKGSFWLALLSLGFALRVFTYVGGLDALIPDRYIFSVHKKIIYATMLSLASLGFLFFQTYFPKQFPRWITQASLVCSIPSTLFICVTPPHIFGFLGNPLTYLGGLFVVVQAVLVTRVFLAKESGGIVCFIGMLGVLTGSLMEVATVMGFFQGILNSMAYGLVIFIAFQSQIVAVRFVEAFRKSEHLSRELQKEVDRQTRDIRSILDAIHQGIFTVVSTDQRIGEQYSPFSHDMFQSEKIQGLSLSELLLSKSRLSNDQKDQINSAISASIGEDELNFELNAACFPQELLFDINNQTKTFELEWSPISNSQGQVEKILLCSRDVTELRILRQAAEQRERELGVLQEIIQISEDRFARFLQQSQIYVRENLDFLAADRSGATQVAKRMFVNLHTLKGTARTYQFRELASRVHDAEHVLSEYIKGHASWEAERIESDLDSIQSCLRNYEAIAREKLRWSLNHSIVKVSKEELIQLLPHLRSLESEGLSASGKAHLASLGNTLLANCYTNLNELIQEVARGLDSIARDLAKAVPELIISPNHYLIDDQWIERLQGTLTHLLRNSLDHGLEKPEDRLRAGKSEQGHIFMNVLTAGTQLRIEIQDDGRGLNLPKITELALQKGLISEGLSSPHETAELIFHSGFSTKSQVSDISGRGVGMDAVRALMTEAGGQVFLELDPHSHDATHQGFAVVLLLPAQAWTRLPEQSELAS